MIPREENTVYPTLVDFGVVTIGGLKFHLAMHSYGFMLGLAILTAVVLFHRDLQRRGMDAEIVNTIFMAAVAGGLVGAKLNYVIREGELSMSSFFSGSGLVWHGGFIGGAAGVVLAMRLKRRPFLPTIDSLAAPLLLGYGIARIGCFLAGDGDYGPPSDLPWAMAFPNGVVPTSVPVHPTPLYELAMSWSAFALLWSVRRRYEHLPGWLLGGYLVLSGAERIVAEFWRRNPKVLAGMTTAQAVSVILLVIGLVLMRRASAGGEAGGGA